MLLQGAVSRDKFGRGPQEDVAFQGSFRRVEEFRV
jgi:hypothetical protein